MGTDGMLPEKPKELDAVPDGPWTAQWCAGTSTWWLNAPAHPRFAFVSDRQIAELVMQGLCAVRERRAER